MKQIKLEDVKVKEKFYLDEYGDKSGILYAKREFGDERDLFCIIDDKMIKLDRKMKVWIE